MRTILGINKAIADLQRLRILMMLQAGELCVCQIVEVLELAPSTVSKHLAILNAARLVDYRKDGRWMYYHLHKDTKATFVQPLLKWLNEMLKDDDIIAQDRKKLKSVMACDPENLCRRQRKKREYKAERSNNKR